MREKQSWMKPEEELLAFPRFLPYLHCKKRLAVLPSPAGMSHTKLSLIGNYSLGQGEYGSGIPENR
jgi:hypothetical protein